MEVTVNNSQYPTLPAHVLEKLSLKKGKCIVCESKTLNWDTHIYGGYI